MGYKIRYGRSRYEKYGRVKRLKILIPSLIIMVILLNFLLDLWGIGVPEHTLAEEGRQLVAALENMRSNLAAGETVTEAIAAFCQEVIDGAGMEE